MDRLKNIQDRIPLIENVIVWPRESKDKLELMGYEGSKVQLLE